MSDGLVQDRWRSAVQLVDDEVVAAKVRLVKLVLERAAAICDGVSEKPPLENSATECARLLRKLWLDIEAQV